MKIAKLNIEQYRKLIGQDLGDGTLFNPVINKDGYVILTEHEISQTTNTDFIWVQDLPLIEIYDIPSTNTTPPSMTGYGILIPTEAVSLNLFPDNKFNLNGFIIELTSTSQGLAVDLGYLGWQEFRDEQDNEINSTIKASFSALWYELLTRYNNGEIIQL